MDGGVVELNALADSDWASAKNDDLLLVGQAGFVLEGWVNEVLIGGIEVSDVLSGVEGIDHLVGWDEIVLNSLVIDIELFLFPELGDVLIGEAHDLSSFENLKVTRLGGNLLFHIDDFLERFQE